MKPYCMLTYYILILTITFFIACKKDKKNEKPLTFRSDSNTVAVDSLAQNNAGISTAGSLVDAFKGPEQYFEMANQMFITQQMSSAATEIKQAKKYLDKEIKKSKNPKALQSAKKQLEFLANRLDKGEKVKESELMNAFVDANMALYKNFNQQYELMYTDYATESKQIGMYLDAALQKVENIDRWSAKKLDADARKIMREGKTLSNRMKTDLKKDKNKAKQEWAKFKQKLKDLDSKLEGNRNGIL